MLMTRVLAGVCVLGVVAAAQDAAMARFDVTSVKANTSGQPSIGGPGDRFSNGRFQTTNIPLRVLMRQAFERFEDGDIVGGPSWLDSDRWDIVATAEAPTAPLLPMIRSLLVDRFKLAFHFEQRERAIYTLSLVRDGKLGPSLRVSGGGQTSFLGSTGVVTGHAITLPLLAKLLGAEVGRAVADRTGLRGTYDLDLRFTPALSSRAALDSDIPDIFTAIREQLGLRLDSSRGPLDVLVIDRIDKPSAD